MWPGAGASLEKAATALRPALAGPPSGKLAVLVPHHPMLALPTYAGAPGTWQLLAVVHHHCKEGTAAWAAAALRSRRH